MNFVQNGSLNRSERQEEQLYSDNLTQKLNEPEKELNVAAELIGKS